VRDEFRKVHSERRQQSSPTVPVICENTTSSRKPEVRSAVHSRRRRSEPRPPSVHSKLCQLVMQFLPARRYASAGTSYGPVSVSLSVCLLQVGVLSKEMNGLICFFGTEASFDQSYTGFQGNSDIYKISALSSRTFY